MTDAPVETTTHPIRIIARKERLDLRRDARWRALALATVLLMLAALAAGLTRSQQLERERQAAQRGDREVWTAQGSKNPHSAAHFGQYAFKPVGPLALADPGVSDYVGQAIYLEAHRQNEAQFRSARDGTLAARMGHLSLAFVLQTVLPLMAILLGFAAISGEREQGTLPQLLSLGVKPIHLLMGKALAQLGALLGLLVLSIVGMTAGLALFGSRPTTDLGNDGLRLLSMAAAYALYLAGFTALALAVSAWSRSSRSALVGLLVFWLLNSFLVPRWVTDAARGVDPLPTALAFRDEMTKDKRKLFGHDEAHPGFIAFRDRVLKQYGVSRIEDLPVSFRGLSLREDDEAGFKISDRHFHQLQARIERQDAWRAAPGWVFPMLALQPFSMAMAGVDNRHHHDFINAAEAHRRLIQTAASQDIIDHAKNGDNAYEADEETWATIPSFSYQTPSVGWAWRTQGLNFTALAVWCLACCLGAVWAVNRSRS